MSFLNLINRTFNFNDTNITENFSFVNIDIQIQGSELLSNTYNEDFIKELFVNIDENDTLKFFINYQGAMKVAFRDINSISSTLSDYNESLFEADYIYNIKIEIQKQISNNNTIYAFEPFYKWLCTYSNVEECFIKYKDLQNIKGSIYFYLQDQEEINFHTKRFIFYSNPNDSIVNNCSLQYPDVNKLLNYQKEHCFLSVEVDYKMIPDDFYLLKESNIDNINSLFNKMCMLLTFTFLTDITEIKKNSIYFKLYGYKTIKNEYEVNTIKTKYLKDFFKIYEWVYQDNQQSTISDKLGIVRNLITLHLTNNSLDDIEGDIVTAIKSNFDIYLKENVQRYLEVKNQVSSFIYDMSLKAETSAEELAITFKNNLFIFISYFISVIVITAIDKGKFVNIFTFEVTSITLLILLISWFHRKNTISDIENKKERFRERYISFKQRYSDIIDTDNLKKLFNDDTDHNSDISYIKNSISRHNTLWKRAIIIFSLVTIVFCIFNSTSDCVENIIKLFYKITSLFS